MSKLHIRHKKMGYHHRNVVIAVFILAVILVSTLTKAQIELKRSLEEEWEECQRKTSNFSKFEEGVTYDIVGDIVHVTSQYNFNPNENTTAFHSVRIVNKSPYLFDVTIKKNDTPLYRTAYIRPFSIPDGASGQTTYVVRLPEYGVVNGDNVTIDYWIGNMTIDVIPSRAYPLDIKKLKSATAVQKNVTYKTTPKILLPSGWVWNKNETYAFAPCVDVKGYFITPTGRVNRIRSEIVRSERVGGFFGEAERQLIIIPNFAVPPEKNLSADWLNAVELQVVYVRPEVVQYIFWFSLISSVFVPLLFGEISIKGRERVLSEIAETKTVRDVFTSLLTIWFFQEGVIALQPSSRPTQFTLFDSTILIGFLSFSIWIIYRFLHPKKHHMFLDAEKSKRRILGRVREIIPTLIFLGILALMVWGTINLFCYWYEPG